jgi:hypothetical protein
MSKARAVSRVARVRSCPDAGTRPHSRLSDRSCRVSGVRLPYPLPVKPQTSPLRTRSGRPTDLPLFRLTDPPVPDRRPGILARVAVCPRPPRSMAVGISAGVMVRPDLWSAGAVGRIWVGSDRGWHCGVPNLTEVTLDPPGLVKARSHTAHGPPDRQLGFLLDHLLGGLKGHRPSNRHYVCGLRGGSGETSDEFFAPGHVAFAVERSQVLIHRVDGDA